MGEGGERSEPGEASPPANIVIGLSLPQWRHTPWAEPMIMVQHYDPLKLSDETACDIAAWKAKAREWWDDAFAPPPEEALRVARMALDKAMSDEDVRAAAEAAPYILDTCRPTVRREDEEADEEELDDDVRSIVMLFEGATVVRLKPRPPSEDDEIPYEALDRESCWAEVALRGARRAGRDGGLPPRIAAKRRDHACCRHHGNHPVASSPSGRRQGPRQGSMKWSLGRGSRQGRRFDAGKPLVGH